LCTRFRDISQLLTNLLQISMFLTPIFWLPEQLGGRFSFIVDYNILYHYIEMVRRPLLGQAPSAWSYCYVLLFTALGWSLAVYLLKRFRHRLPYWL
jgi:lipopolysaccharide transport system permease protein